LEVLTPAFDPIAEVEAAEPVRRHRVRCRSSRQRARRRKSAKNCRRTRSRG